MVSKPRLAKDELREAVIGFATKLRETLGGGADDVGEWPFKWRESDDPIENRSDQTSSNGPYPFRDPRFRQAYYPGADYPGVYLFFDSSEVAVYVGKSETAMGHRIYQHIGPAGHDGTFPDCEWGDEAEFVYVVRVPSECAFLAPALESYLLSKYSFARNKVLAG